jgi:hypothetical protein
VRDRLAAGPAKPHAFRRNLFLAAVEVANDGGDGDSMPRDQATSPFESPFELPISMNCTAPSSPSALAAGTSQAPLIP